MSSHAVTAGTKGAVRLHAPFWSSSTLTVSNDSEPPEYPVAWPQAPGPHGRKEHFPLPSLPAGKETNYANSVGFSYEALAVMNALREGRTSVDEISDNESLRIMCVPSPDPDPHCGPQP